MNRTTHAESMRACRRVLRLQRRYERPCDRVHVKQTIRNVLHQVDPVHEDFHDLMEHRLHPPKKV